MKFKLTSLAIRLLANRFVWVFVAALMFCNIAASQSSELLANPQSAASDAKTMLAQAAANLENSNPLQCSTRLQIDLFDQELVAEGLYSQMGQGSGLSRLEFNFGNVAKPRKILHICNQGYYYRFRTTAKDPELNFADLRRIADSDSANIMASPNTWMATGGLASLLKVLADNFVFEKPEATKLSDLPVWRIRGGWDERRLKRMLFGQVKYAVIEDGVNWEKVPPQVPYSCEIVLGRDDFFPLFPYQISYFRFEGKEKQKKSKPQVAFELYDLKKNANLDIRSFDVNFPNVIPTDLTDQYVDRILQLHKIQRSAKQPADQRATR